MRYKRVENKAECYSNISIESEFAYVSKIIDVYSAAEVHHSFWMTPKEKLFFLCIYYCVKNGIRKITSKEAIDIFKEYFKENVSRSEITTYFSRLKKNGWLDRDEKKMIILPYLFDEITGDGDIVEFNIKISNDKH